MAELIILMLLLLSLFNIIGIMIHFVVTEIESTPFVLNNATDFISRVKLFFFMFLFSNSVFLTERTYREHKLENIYEKYKTLNVLGKILFVCSRDSIFKENTFGSEVEIVPNISGLFFGIKFLLLPLIPLILFLIFIVKVSYYGSYHPKGNTRLKNLVTKPQKCSKCDNNLNSIYK